MESVRLGAIRYANFPCIRATLYRAGSAEYESPGGGAEERSAARSADDADGRCGSAGALVFRVKRGAAAFAPHGRADGSSAFRASDASVAHMNSTYIRSERAFLHI